MKKLTVIAMLLSGALISPSLLASSVGTTGGESQPATKATQEEVSKGDDAKSDSAKTEHEAWCKKYPEKCEKMEKRKAERHERREKRKADRLQREEKRKAERQEHKTEKSKTDVQDGSKK